MLLTIHVIIYHSCKHIQGYLQIGIQLNVHPLVVHGQLVKVISTVVLSTADAHMCNFAQ